ncbi:sulfite exporter TauE/SafE family protein [Lignipirellula cremea]|uniref:Probable membrane transporter protein n=1 Tax=Lignipirellula cremea TaxID=2528010 RepID=A0A518DM90_9BACT|nr:sulfite exporter TauE/SafE family protein [Lignipirellula cremea]QDU92943.1 Sulfite exporter TauE/SafE [Lignipirellula cremea]
MDLTLVQYVLAAAILFVASFVQGSIGFAAGLIAIPALAQIGLSMPEAIAANLIASGLQNIAGLVELRKDIDWGIALRPALIRIATIPLGMAALVWLASIDKTDAQQVLGVIILAALILQLTARVKPQEHLHFGWEVLAFSAGGFFVGFCGMGGPPMMLWVMAHNWSTQKSRAFMFSMFITSIVPQALMMLWWFGLSVGTAMLFALFSAPVCYLGSYLGVKAGDIVSRKVMRNLVYATLTVVAVKALVMPLWSSRPTPQAVESVPAEHASLRQKIEGSSS